MLSCSPIVGDQLINLSLHSPRHSTADVTAEHIHSSVLVWASGSYLLTYICVTFRYNDGLQHKGAISTKPFFKKIAKIQRSYVPLCGHTTFVLLKIIYKITIFCNDVNKTSTSIQSLVIVLCCMSERSNVGLGIKSMAGLKPLWKSEMEIMPLHVHWSLMNCFNKVIFHFCKISHFVQRLENLGLSPGIKYRFRQKVDISTFVLSTGDNFVKIVAAVFQSVQNTASTSLFR